MNGGTSPNHDGAPLNQDDLEAVGPEALTALSGFFPRSGSSDDDTASDAAERLRDLELRYRALVDQLPAVIYIDGLGTGSQMVDVSPSIETTLGIPREEWLAHAGVWESAIHPDDRQRVVEVSRHAAEFGEPFRIEYRAIHRDGRMLWIREDCVLIRDEVGEPVYWLGLMLDVTELAWPSESCMRCRRSSARSSSRSRRSSTSTSPTTRMTTTYVSPQIGPLLGYTPTSTSTIPACGNSMLHPDDRDGAVETYLRGRESGEPFVFEYRLVGPGRERSSGSATRRSCCPTPRAAHGSSRA